MQVERVFIGVHVAEQHHASCVDLSRGFMASTFVTVSFAVTMTAAGAAFATQEPPTLIEEAAAVHTETLRKTLLRETPLKSLEQLAADADLILEGTLTPTRTYLSKSQREIYTDYLIAPAAVHAQRSVYRLRQPECRGEADGDARRA